MNTTYKKLIQRVFAHSNIYRVMYATSVHSLLFFLILYFTSQQCIFTSAAGGSWKLLKESIGIPAMHMQLLHNDRVIILDRTEFGPSNLSLPAGQCQSDPTLNTDCTAHSIEYDVQSNTVRPLTVKTNTWCSAGSVMPDGSLVQTGGFNGGVKKVRIFKPCNDGSCDWVEQSTELASPRWYPSNQRLPDGRQIIIGGTKQFNYEFYPKIAGQGSVSLPFLSETADSVENNLYPFVHLNVDGNLFIFANNRAILFDYVNNQVVKTYPTIPGGEARNYPSSGSSVLLPLKNIQDLILEAEVLICGGGANGSYTQSQKKIFLPALNSCGRIKITDPNPQWVMETMPSRRVMGDMILLPNGKVLLISGAELGSAGWEQGRNPVLSPTIYSPDNPLGSRFEVQNPSTIPRMYHSTAILLRNGRVLVGGSNPHARDSFGQGVIHPTELRLETFSPEYLDPQFDGIRPTITAPVNGRYFTYGQRQKVRFSCTEPIDTTQVVVNLVAPSFATHSYSMNQKLLVLGNNRMVRITSTIQDVEVTMPLSKVLAPPGYYLLFVIHKGTPGPAIWIRMQ